MIPKAQVFQNVKSNLLQEINRKRASLHLFSSPACVRVRPTKCWPALLNSGHLAYLNTSLSYGPFGLFFSALVVLISMLVALRRGVGIGTRCFRYWKPNTTQIVGTSLLKSSPWAQHIRSYSTVRPLVIFFSLFLPSIQLLHTHLFVLSNPLY